MARTVFFTTIEDQVRNDGAHGLLYDHFDDYNAALAKYFTVCAAAATSGIPYHSAYIIRNDGVMIERQVFDRRADDEPEIDNSAESNEEV